MVLDLSKPCDGRHNWTLKLRLGTSALTMNCTLGLPQNIGLYFLHVQFSFKGQDSGDYTVGQEVGVHIEICTKCSVAVYKYRRGLFTKIGYNHSA